MDWLLPGPGEQEHSGKRDAGGPLGRLRLRSRGIAGERAWPGMLAGEEIRGAAGMRLGSEDDWAEIDRTIGGDVC